MNIPTPSFLNIRVVALIIISFVLCFLVGAVKDVFGQDYPGECVVNLIDKRSTTSDTTYTSIPNFYFDVDENGAMIVTSSNSGTGLKDVVRFSQGFLLQTFWWDKDALIFKPSYTANMPIGMLVPSSNVASWPQYPSELPESCAPPCEDEKQALIDQCGQQTVDWSNWSDETCSGGSCYGCPDPGDELWQNTCIPKCKNTEFRDELGICRDQPTCEEAAVSDQTQCTLDCQSQGLEEGIYSCVQTPGGVSEDCRCTDLKDMPFEKMALPDPATSAANGGDGLGNGETHTPDPAPEPVESPENPVQSPSDSPSEIPETESGKWLKPIKEDLGKIITGLGTLKAQGDVDNKNDGAKISILGSIDTGIGTITSNQGIISKQLGAVVTNTGTAVKGIGAIVDGIAGLETAIKDLDEIDVTMPDTMTLAADTTDLGVDNVYDAELEPVEEDTFFAMVGDYVSSNVPILNYIQGSNLSVTGSDSTLSCVVWGKTVQADISPYKGLLNKAGLVLVFVASVISFQIVVARVA